ncbi:MAG: DMT family transporter [Pseudomonadota bacterium]
MKRNTHRLERDDPGRRAYRRGVLLIVLGSLSSSWIGLGVRMVEQASAWQILVYRSFSLVVFLCLILALRRGVRFAGSFRKAGPVGLVGGVGLAVALSGGIIAIEKAPVANALFLLAAAPFMAALLGLVFLKEAVPSTTWLAIALAFAGIFIMVSDGLSLGYFWGSVAGLATATGLAVYIFSLRWGRLNDMLPLSIIAGVLSFFTALAICLINGSSLVLSPNDLLISLAMGVFQLGIALVLITEGSKTVPSADIALLAMTETVAAPLWVWLLLGEAVSPLTLMGGALVMLAITFEALCGIRKRR